MRPDESKCVVDTAFSAQVKGERERKQRLTVTYEVLCGMVNAKYAPASVHCYEAKLLIADELVHCQRILDGFNAKLREAGLEVRE